MGEHPRRERDTTEHATRRAGAGALLAFVLAIGASAGPAHAAPPVADPGAGPSRPTVETTGNGTPIVQITNPSAAGVSRNQFTRFDVDPGGLILNNSTGLAQTELAGWVAKNPNLTRSASVILNEVTGADPSRLLGSIEVAGQRAEVVIANQNGITCNGCGFINVGRATLTTGAPVFGGAGTLDAYRVVGGTIAVEGTGLDAGTVDQVDLISRAVTANAGIWANQLDVVTGPNQVDRSTLAATPIAGAGAAPAVSLDIGALGGMYAGKILLLGTERGVGVTSAGTLASTGEFRLLSDGRIVLRGSTTAGGPMTVRAASLDSQGTLYAGAALRIDATGAVTTAGLLAAQGDLTVQAGQITLGGLTGAGLSPEAELTGVGALTLTAEGAVAAGGQQLVATGDVAVTGGSLGLAGATVQAGGNAALVARSGGTDLTGAQVDAGAALTVTAAGGDVQLTDGTLAAGGAVTASASGTFDNTRGLVIGNEVEISADQIRSQGAEAAIVSAGDLRLHATTSLENADGSLLYAGGDLTIDGGPAIASGGEAAAAGSVVNRSATIETGGNLTVIAAELRNEKSVYEVTYDVPPVLSAEAESSVRRSEYPDSFWYSFVSGGWDVDDGWSDKYLVTQTATYVPQVIADSAPATLRAGGDITLRVGSVVNDQSLIAAGGNIVDAGVTFVQPALPGTRVDNLTWYRVTAEGLKYCSDFEAAFGCTTSHNGRRQTFYSTPVVDTSDTEALPNPAQLQRQTGVTPAAPGITAQAATITLPSTRLFTVHPDPGARYLVETDPRFTKLGHFITSNYLLDQLPVNPEAPIKRLGDGFYEQRLVMDELFRATGTPYLPGFRDAMAQYQALMDEGLVFARRFNLSPGIALSAEQLINLTAPMVWMVTVRVNGQDVLAPKVYVPSGKEVAVTGGGAVVAGGGVAWKLSGKLEVAGRVTAGKDLTASAGSVRSSGGALTAGGDARIEGKSGVQLDAATVAAAGNVSIASKDGDVTMGVAQRHTSGDGVLVAGVTGTQVAAGGAVDVRAGGDVRLTAATIQGTTGVGLAAGRDLSLETAQEVTITDVRHEGDRAGTVATTQVGTTIVAAQGSVQATAGRDARLQGATVAAAGDVLLAAGGDLSLTAATDSVSGARQRSAKFSSTYDETARGTTVQGGGAITLAALGTADEGTGRVALEAATVQAGGALTVQGRDVSISDARELHTTVTTNSWSKRGFLSKKSVTTRDEVDQDLAVGSLLSGGTVQVVSEGDLLVQGSQVVGQGDVELRALGDVTIAAGEDRFTEKHERVETRSGWLGSNGGIGFTIGTRRKEVTTDVDGVSHLRDGGDGTTITTASTVGSVEGGLVIDAGRRLDTRGSDLTAAGDISLAGEDVLVESVYDVTRTHQTTVITQTGFTVAVNNGAVDAGLAVYNSIHRATEVKDDRLKALYALRALRQAQVAAEAMKALAQNKGNARSVSITLGATHSESRAESTTVSSAALGSSIVAGGNVSIVARGDAAQEHGDLTVIGSTVEGGSVTLDAARDLVLRSAENRLDTSSDSLSWSVTAGVGVTVGNGKAAAGFRATGNIQSSDEDGHDRTFTETAIRSAGAITLRTGRDATLRGATVNGGSIAADIGRDLRLESQQDSSTYHSTDLSASGEATIGYGYSVNLTAGYAGMESSYRSVHEQTGLFAGAGGYQVHVGGNTDLKGAAIASEADPSKNLLDTGSLTFSNLGNESKYSAVSASITVGTGGVSPSVGAPIQGEKSSTTYAAVSPGTIIVRSGQQDLSGLSRDTAHAINAIGNIFDKASVQERKELVQVFGEEGFKLVGDLAQHFTKPYTDAKQLEETAQKYKELLQKDPSTFTEEDERILELAADSGITGANVDATLARARAEEDRYRGQYETWRDGSAAKTALHGLVGAVQASLAGGGGAAASGGIGAATSEAASRLTEGLPPDQQKWASLIIGSAAARLAGGQGLNALAGGATALTGNEFNRQLHQSEVEVLKRLAKDWKQLGFSSEDAALTYYFMAACSMVQCGEEMPEDDPNREKMLAISQAGGGLYAAQSQLRTLAERMADDALAAEYDRVRQNLQTTGHPGTLAPPQRPIPMFEPTEGKDWWDQNVMGTRVGGGIQLVGGTLEMGAGVTAAPSCATAVGCVVAAGAVVHGFDTAYTGWNTLWYGKQFDTSLVTALKQVGVPANIAYSLDMAASLGLAGGSSIISAKAAQSTGVTPSMLERMGVQVDEAAEAPSAFHATKAGPTQNPGQIAQNVLDGINPKFLGADNRFGKAFYVAEQPETALAELAHHGVDPAYGIRYSVDLTKARVLDLTDPVIAAEWGYAGGEISEATKAIGAAARDKGYNVIRFVSERGSGANLAVLDDFNQVLRPQMVTPIATPLPLPAPAAAPPTTLR